MTEGSSDALRPETIIIRGPELEEAEEEVALDDDGLPPPVKAVTRVEAPHTPAGGHLQVRIGVSLLAALMLCFSSLIWSPRLTGKQPACSPPSHSCLGCSSS